MLRKGSIYSYWQQAYLWWSKKLQIYMYMKYLHVGIYKITCSWLCFHDVQIVSSSVEKREISHLDKQKRYNTLRCIAVQTLVSVPDPKPTPARIAFSIARGEYWKRYTRRMRSGDKTIQTSVNFDLRPWNSLDIVALVGCFELYRKREKVGNKTWPFLYWHYYIIFLCGVSLRTEVS